MLQALTRAQAGLVERRARWEIFDDLLTALLSLTRSELGYLSEVVRGPDGSATLHTDAVACIAWDEEFRNRFREAPAAGLAALHLEGLAARVLAEGSEVVDDAPDQVAATDDPGDPSRPLHSMLGLPIYAGGELVGSVGVANRRGGYDSDLQQFLKPFLLTCANIIVSLRDGASRQRAEEALRENVGRFEAILDSAVDAIITISERGVIESVNKATELIFGYTAAELVGAKVNRLMAEPHRTEHDDYLRRHLQTGESKVIGRVREMTARRKDGSEFPIDLAVNRVDLDDRILFTGIVRDITDRRAHEVELRRVNVELARRVAELDAINRENALVGELASFLQAAETIEEVNGIFAAYVDRLLPGTCGALYWIDEYQLVRRAVRWGDWSAQAVFDKSACWALRRGEAHSVHRPDHPIDCRHWQEGPPQRSTCSPLVTRDGTVGVLCLDWSAARGAKRGEPLPCASLEACNGLVALLSERLGTAFSSIQLRQRMREESVRDPLTRLYNRRYMEGALREALLAAEESGRPFSLLMIDIDHFKRLNDTLGHDAGDLVLQQVSAALAGALRADDVVCRYGGEEFVVMMAGADQRRAVERAEQLRELVKAKVAHPGRLELGALTVSIGVAGLAEGDTAASLLGRADKALYQAKGQGRDRVVFAGQQRMEGAGEAVRIAS